MQARSMTGGSKKQARKSEFISVSKLSVATDLPSKRFAVRSLAVCARLTLQHASSTYRGSPMSASNVVTEAPLAENDALQPLSQFPSKGQRRREYPKRESLEARVRFGVQR